jgi:hypothetical protein
MVWANYPHRRIFYIIIPKNLLPSRNWYLMFKKLSYGVNPFMKLAFYGGHFIIGSSENSVGSPKMLWYCKICYPQTLNESNRYMRVEMNRPQSGGYPKDLSEHLPRSARLVFCVEPPHQTPRSSESAVALSADESCITLLY